MPLERKTLNVLMSLMSLVEVENYMQFCLILYEYTVFCWIYVMLGYVKLKGSVVKYPHPCTDWQQILVQDIEMYRAKSPSRLTVHIGRFRRSQVVISVCFVHVCT